MPILAKHLVSCLESQNCKFSYSNDSFVIDCDKLHESMCWSDVGAGVGFGRIVGTVFDRNIILIQRRCCWCRIDIIVVFYFTTLF